MPDMGTPEQLKLSSVFDGEAADFTPWLSKNLDNLANKLGIELNSDDTEVNVGTFRVDITARTSDGRIVIIENQFERTDHTHLGQLLTYAGGLNADIIIWIAERFRPEHRAAIDWLNDHAAGADFFAVEARAVRIDNSLPALFWDIVASPNDWTRVGGPIKTDKLGPVPKLRFEYWTALNQMIEEKDARLTRFKPDTTMWQSGSIGTGDFLLNTSLNSKDKWIRVEIYLDGDKSNEWFNKLQEQKSEIEEKLGYGLKWEPLESRRACRISIPKDADPTNQEDWPRQHEWIIQKRLEFERVFRPLVRSVVS